MKMLSNIWTVALTSYPNWLNINEKLMISLERLIIFIRKIIYRSRHSAFNDLPHCAANRFASPHWIHLFTVIVVVFVCLCLCAFFVCLLAKREVSSSIVLAVPKRCKRKLIHHLNFSHTHFFSYVVVSIIFGLPIGDFVVVVVFTFSWNLNKRRLFSVSIACLDVFFICFKCLYPMARRFIPVHILSIVEFIVLH